MRSLQLCGREVVGLRDVVVGERRPIECDGRIRHVAVGVIDEDVGLRTRRSAEDGALRLPRATVRIDPASALEPIDVLECRLTGVEIEGRTVRNGNGDAGRQRHGMDAEVVVQRHAR